MSTRLINMDFSQMTVDDIINYLYTEADNQHVITIDDLDKAVESCSVVDRFANENAITIFYSGGEDNIINEIADTGNPDVRLIRRTDAFKLLASSSQNGKDFRVLVYSALKNEHPSYTVEQLNMMTDQKMFGVSAVNSSVSEVGEGYWAKISARFASETRGDAYSLCTDAAEDRIFSRDELKQWLAAVDDNKTMNGIKKSDLSRLTGEARFNCVVEAARADLADTSLSLTELQNDDGSRALGKTGRDFEGSLLEKYLPNNRVKQNDIQVKSGDYTKAADVFHKVNEIEITEANLRKTISILDMVGGTTDKAVIIIKAANNNVDDVLKVLGKTDNSIDDIIYALKAAKGNVDDAIVILEEIGKNTEPEALLKKYKFCVNDPYVLEFYKTVERRIALGEDPSKVFVKQLFDDTKVQFKANNYLLVKDIKELRLDDFLEFAKHEYGISFADDAAKVSHSTRIKLNLTQSLRAAGNVAATAVQLYLTVKFIVEMAQGLDDGSLTPRDVGEKSTAFIASSAGAWLASEAVVAAGAVVIPLLAINPIVGGVAVLLLALGAGFAGSAAGEWLADLIYQPSYDTAWALLDYAFSGNVQMHLLEGSENSDIMDFSNGRIEKGLFNYQVKYGVDVDGLHGDDIILGYIYDDIIHGNEDNDIIHGGKGNDSITGDDGYDSLYGDEGNDHIDGGNGVDVIDGGEGDDILNGNNDDDIIRGGSGNDRISGGEGGDYLYGENGNDYLNGDRGRDYVDGGDGNDILYGDQAGDMLGGDDTLYGGRGNDEIYGGYGEDAIFGGDGDDLIYGDDKETINTYHGDSDVISGGAGNDTIYGGAEADFIWGDEGNDRIYGNDDDDTISGGLGQDRIMGGDGDDLIYGDEKDDHLHGDGDFIYGENGKDTIYAEAGNDTINGGNGNDVIYGDDGDDLIYGSAGHDIIDGGNGCDTLRGGDGDDTYIYSIEFIDSTNVYDEYGMNTVKFVNISSDPEELNNSLTFTMQGKNLVITSVESGESMTITGYSDQKDHFTFKAEGSTATFELNDSMELVETDHIPTGCGSALGNLKAHSNKTFIVDFNKASKEQPPRDPLVIDLNGDGVHTSTVEDGVHFDIDNNGFAEKTAWIDAIDGFLVFNRDEDPHITNGSELFSDQVIFESGAKSAHGFEVLQAFDTNGDHVVDSRDEHFNDLRIWVDANRDGTSFIPAENEAFDPNKQEIFTLKEKGIASISTIYHDPDPDNQNEEKNIYATVTFEDGTTTTISEHWFNAETSDTQELNTDGVDDDLTSFGNLHSISYAIAQGGNDYLRVLVEQFKASVDYLEKRVLAKKILYIISGADQIRSDSRGGSIDARDLHILETIMGVEEFVGAGNTRNPNTNAAAILRNMYSKFEELYFNILNKDTAASSALSMICEDIDANGNLILNMDVLNKSLEGYVYTEHDDNILSIFSYLTVFDNAHGSNYASQFRTAHPEAADMLDRYTNLRIVYGSEDADTTYGTNNSELIYTGEGNDTVNAAGGNDVIFTGNGDDTVSGGVGNDEIHGEEGNDVLNGNEGADILYGGSGSDTLNGGADHDVIYGGDGDDLLTGGTGDDVLEGGSGDDTYYFSTEHGNDVIRDSEGQSRLVFETGIDADEYRLGVDISGGILLINKETNESISVPDFLNDPFSYTFEFNGTESMPGGGSVRQTIEGTEEADIITAADGFNVIYGDDGNDTITGGSDLNFIYGGDGNDSLFGGTGTNIIRGENGDDLIRDGDSDSYLDGGEGRDTIYAGGGNDVVIGGSGADELHGEDGDDAIAGNDGDDVLYGENGNDTLYADAGNDDLYGGSGDDALFGGDGDDTLRGEDGDDYLESGSGTDTLYGGTGNDTLVSGEGITYLYGEDGDDTFHGGNGLNYMYGADGDDIFTGGELADYIEGGAGNDTMNGGNGSNEMYGGEGDDAIYGGNDEDYIEGGTGSDQLYGGNGVNTIYGGEGDDIIYSGEDGSFLYGGEGDDQIYAGGGADVLDGGAGNDYLQGDHGGDTYIFDVGYDADTIHASADLNTITIHGYTAEDMHNSREANHDLIVDFGDSTGDRLIVQGFFDYNINRDFQFVFDDGTILGQYDIQAGAAPIIGTEADEWLSIEGNEGSTIHAGAGNDGLNGGSGADELYGEAGDDSLFGNDGNDLLDGGEGNDSLSGGNGEDTYIFAKGYAQDTINEWGSDHSIVELRDISSDEIIISDQWGSNLLLSVIGTDDVLMISNFKWGQATFTFKFADGAEGYIDKETWQLVLTKQPDVIADAEQTGAEILETLYENDGMMADFLFGNSTVISDVTESASVGNESNSAADMTDVQAMLLAESMATFGNSDQISDSMNIADITANTSLTDALLVSAMQ